MALYLVQHGKSLPKDADPEKGLSGEGIEEVKRIAERALQHEIPVSVVRHSGKKRARQTAEILAEALQPEKGVEAAEGLKPLDDVTVCAETVSPGDNVMLVGHLPFMERMAGYLTTGNPDQSVIQFRNGGIVCLDEDADKGWTIRWAMLPRYA